MSCTCEHPVHLFTLTGERTVPCGRCKSCLVDKSSHNSFITQYHSSQYKYCFFFTLTYADWSIPSLNVSTAFGNDDLYYFTMDCPRRNDHEKLMFTKWICDKEEKKKLDKLISGKTHRYGCINFPPVDDAQNFLKRLRQYLVRNHNEEKIKYYMVSEYGPVHFRAHWHGLLFFNERQTLRDVRKGISKSWQYGRVDADLSKGKANGYCVSYVNAAGYLPTLYKDCKLLKPRSLHSNYLGSEKILADKDEVYEKGLEYFGNLSVRFNQKTYDIRPWRSLVSALYPRCAEFAKLTTRERYAAYTLYRIAQNEFGHGLTVSELCKAALTNAWQSSPEFPCNSFVASKMFIDCSKTWCEDLLRVMPEYVFDVYGDVSSEYYHEHSPYGELSNSSLFCESAPKPFSKYRGTHYLAWVTFMKRYPRYYELIYRRLYKALFVSKRFYEWMCHCDWRNADTALYMLETFYDDKKQYTLSKWYEIQEQVSINQFEYQCRIAEFYPDIYNELPDNVSTDDVKSCLMSPTPPPSFSAELWNNIYRTRCKARVNNVLTTLIAKKHKRFNTSVKHRTLNEQLQNQYY